MNQNTLSVRLKEEMNKKNLKILTLTSKTNLSRNAIYKILNNKTIPFTNTLVTIAASLSVTPGYLIGISDRKSPTVVEYPKEYDENIFGSRVKQELYLQKIKQKDLAELSSLNKHLVNRIIKGRGYSPSLHSVVSIANALHVSIDYLLGFHDDKQIR